jgi:hypothetical protein
MRTYLVVILIIILIMGGYVALQPYADWTDANTGLTAAAPG